MKLSEIGSQDCSIARALSVVGDGWMLVILRDAFRGRRRFSDFEEHSGAQSNVISDRLKRMVDLGILQRVEYQQHPSRHEYRLTDKGRDLYPALLMLSTWGDKYLDDGDGPPVSYVHTGCGHAANPHVACAHCGDEIDVRSLRARRVRDTSDATPGSL
ncbi:MAG: winged helix-turn-helix transcriptional regulator [Acidimicrobiales bacterium]